MEDIDTAPPRQGNWMKPTRKHTPDIEEETRCREFPHRLEEVLIYPTGSVNENVAPSPGSLAAQIVS